MPEKTKKQIIYYLENFTLALVAIFLLFLPILFLATTTDAFILPKQMLLTAVVSISVILFGLKTLIEGKIRFRSTPFDLPVALLAILILASSIFAVNKADSLNAFLPFLFAALLYFVITNTVKSASQLLFILSSLVLGTVLASLLAILSYLKIYPLPFPYTQVQYFNTFGSLLDQAIYLVLILPITGYFVHAIFTALNSKRKSQSLFAADLPDRQAGQKTPNNNKSAITAGFSIAFIIIVSGLAITAYQLATSQKPLILPLETGFQTAFASISQDTGRVFWGFLFGSGLGTYVTDFTRFKPDAFNLDQNLWSFTFFRSSTFVLELLATTGIAGFLAFIFLVYKIIKERVFFLPLILAIISAFLLPFSFTLQIVFFVLLGISAVIHAHNNPNKFTEVELYFVALKRGLLAARTDGENAEHAASRKYNRLLPLFFSILLLVLIGLPLYFSIRYFISDLLYQRSLVAYSQNNGLETYNLQSASINVFPYRDLYYRGISQTNIALANSLALQTREASPSAQDQQNILTLIQQSITAGRNAAIIAPQSSFNWSNLSSIYRNLIGFGENADRFAILTTQQAIALDPKNPQAYLDLGGIYYQLGMFDEAIRQFQTSISLKNDYANAYYNLGHALEMKGNNTEALAAYQIVKTLVVDNKENTKKITEEIQALQNKVNQQASQDSAPQNATSSAAIEGSTTETEPLRINEPGTQLPERDPKVKIPGPTISPTPKGSPTPTPGKSELTPTEKISPTQTP